MKDAKQLRLLNPSDVEQEGLPKGHKRYLEHITGQNDDEPARGRVISDDDDDSPHNDGNGEEEHH